MKIKIDADGFLHIWRGGEFKTQVCPHNRMVALGEDWDTNEYIEKFRICGDWCPLFGEPERYTHCDWGERDRKEGFYERDKVCIALCRKNLVVYAEDITDERNAKS